MKTAVAAAKDTTFVQDGDLKEYAYGKDRYSYSFLLSLGVLCVCVCAVCGSVALSLPFSSLTFVVCLLVDVLVSPCRRDRVLVCFVVLVFVMPMLHYTFHSAPITLESLETLETLETLEP